jgi:hypothetical protein
MEKAFQLKLTLEEINCIMAGLGELPHKVSRGLIDKIVQSVQEQAGAGPAQAGDAIAG